LGSVGLACGGTAFSSDGAGSGGEGGSADGGTGGALDRAGRTNGGSLIGSGGKIASGGKTNGGALGIAGDLVIGGTPAIAGQPSTAGAPPDPIDEACPVNQPLAGGACADGLECSYGTDVRVACRAVATCKAGAWIISKQPCEELHGCNAVIVGNMCDANAKPCMLDFDQGIYCVCTGCVGGGACSNQTVWACAGGPGGSACPKLPPNEGQMCAADTKCSYGSCATANGVSASCNGTWSWDPVACPL
jgi:hypothetical protein